MPRNRKVGRSIKDVHKDVHTVSVVCVEVCTLWTYSFPASSNKLPRLLVHFSLGHVIWPLEVTKVLMSKYDHVSLIFIRLPTDFTQNRRQDVASPKVSSVFVTLTSRSTVKVMVTKMIFEIACLWFFLCLPTDFAQNRKQDVASTGSHPFSWHWPRGQRSRSWSQKWFLRLRVSDFFFVYRPISLKSAHKTWNHLRSHPFSWHWPRGQRSRSQKVFLCRVSLIFSSFTDRFRSKAHTRRGITQGLIRFRDIDLGSKVKVKVTNNAFWDRVSLIFLRLPTDFAQNRTQCVASLTVSSVVAIDLEVKGQGQGLKENYDLVWRWAPRQLGRYKL